MAISIVIVTGNQLRHHYFVNRLNEKFSLKGVVSEAVFEHKIEGNQDDVQVLTRHFAERKEAENRFFRRDVNWVLEQGRLLKISKGAVNSDKVFEWIISKNADYLVLYGSGVIRESLLSAFDLRCINMHLGLSPYYRGSGTNFWPLVNREPELVGTTIHLATADVDAGPILKQARPSIELQDRNHDMGCKAILAGTDIMISSLEQFAHGVLQPTPQSPGGRVYKRGDFNAEAVRRMWRNFDSGMIAEYLAKPERAKRNSIVE